MTLHLKTPFRAEDIGSLIRPAALLEKRKLHEQNFLHGELLGSQKAFTKSSI